MKSGLPGSGSSASREAAGRIPVKGLCRRPGGSDVAFPPGTASPAVISTACRGQDRLYDAGTVSIHPRYEAALDLICFHRADAASGMAAMTTGKTALRRHKA